MIIILNETEWRNQGGFLGVSDEMIDKALLHPDRRIEKSGCEYYIMQFISAYKK